MVKLNNNLEGLLKRKHGDRVPKQTELAKLIGVSQTTVSRWLAQKIDRFDAETLGKFCGYLECNVGDLVFFNKDELERWYDEVNKSA